MGGTIMHNRIVDKGVTGLCRFMCVIAFMTPGESIAHAAKIGDWLRDEKGLPCFEYTGIIPYSANTPNGITAKLQEDPWFLLGNYQLTLFAHVSGEYELITGQRAGGRMN